MSALADEILAALQAAGRRAGTAGRLFERYGPVLTEAQLAEALHLSEPALRQQRQRGDLPVQPITWPGRRSPVWHYEDVATWLDSLRAPTPR